MKFSTKMTIMSVTIRCVLIKKRKRKKIEFHVGNIKKISTTEIISAEKKMRSDRFPYSLYHTCIHTLIVSSEIKESLTKGEIFNKEEL